MAEKLHLAEGSTHPPIKKGILRIYSMRFCPFAQRSVLVATVRGIQFDLVNIDLNNKPNWFLELNQAGTVPLLELDDGRVLRESLIVADYLNEIGDKGKSLHQSDPYRKAKDRVFVEQFNAVIGPFFQFLLSFGKTKPDLHLFDSVLNNLDTFEAELQCRSSKFFAGDEAGMLDLMIWPFFERFEQFAIFGGETLKFPKDRFPCLAEWMLSMLENEAVKTWLLPAETHAQYSRNILFAGGTKDYNFLVKDQE